MLTDRPAVKTRLQAGFCASFLLLAVVAACLHHYIVSGNERTARLDATGQIGLALAKGILDDNLPAPAVYESICKRIASSSAEVLAVRMWNTKGEVLSETGLEVDGLDHLTAPTLGARGGPILQKQIPDWTAAGTKALISRVDISIPGLPGIRPPCSLALAVSGVRPAWTGAFWSFVGWYGGACLLIAAGAWVAIHRSIFAPLEALAGTGTDTGDPGTATNLTERQDEWGMIARSLSAIRREMLEWRDHANRTERRLESRLAAQTREILRDLKRFQREAWIDALTGVKNRRLLEEKLPEVFAAQRAAGHDLAIAMIDLDNFKKLNDTCGHQSGDAVLKFAGELFRQCLRGHDIAVRYGGDEFVLILPGLSAKEAYALVRRISSLFVQRAKTMADVQIPIGFTSGIASLENNEPRTPADLLACADHALYQAKKSGRGRARICEPSHQGAVRYP
ncbi:MAG: GGDEF domain-containing protein [Planctomycetia bacterium]|nr:GGDEF domain-containing protein [Planctomycetia bacterium]